MPNIRPSPIAGSWYPGRADQLADSVDAYLRQAELPPVQEDLVGVVAPHAGHVYSGPVAAFAFAPLRGLAVDTVALVGPLHGYAIEPLLTSGHDAYRTPLGDVPVDAAGLDALRAACPVPITAIYRDPEHSLDIELPFLQRVLGAFQIIPIMVRDDSPETVLALGRGLAAALQGRRGLLVASSDLSHFYPQAQALRLDHYMLSQIETFDPLAVLAAEEEGRGFACGHGPIAAVLAAARGLGGRRVKVVKHATSGDVSGDYSRVVGYGAALISK
jgi:AmmeMemoRadiSam system protein B